LQSLFTDQNDSQGVVKCSDSEFQSYINALEQSDGCDVLAGPRVTTTQGCPAHLTVQDKVMIAGENHVVGPALLVLPSLSEDGSSVDLTAIAQYNIAETGAADGDGQH
jgi:type II secretory pathway component GspD/PulD (secretin)